MEKYKVKKRIRIIQENTTITDTDFSDWMAVNTGTSAVVVDKVELQPKEGIPYMNLHPDVKYDSPIHIVIPTAGGQVTLYQLIYQEQH